MGGHHEEIDGRAFRCTARAPRTDGRAFRCAGRAPQRNGACWRRARRGIRRGHRGNGRVHAMGGRLRYKGTEAEVVFAMAACDGCMCSGRPQAMGASVAASLWRWPQAMGASGARPQVMRKCLNFASSWT